MGSIRILVAGIGGVGGFFGGLLAKQFEDNPKVEVSFLARGAHLKKIQEAGLTVIEGEEQFEAVPKLATDKASEIGKVDYIMVCTKSYDLEQTIAQLAPCIGSHTVILPLLNGVDCRDRIQELVPNNLVCDGCVYIIARLSRPGVVENLGNIKKLFFGMEGGSDARLYALDNLLRIAGVAVTLTPHIEKVIWEKFVFISVMATATTYFNAPVGPILADANKRNIVTALVNEVALVAEAKGIAISNNMAEQVLAKLESLPSAATSSLHSDFESKRKKNEIQSLIGYVVTEGRNQQVDTPIYVRLFSEILGKTS
ncbi:ketopantoate reductase family protein [Flagellimonas myxillae]|uniref:ketopantoate reductase family protein n=1 Tax=Flagellimonas myxillae TaxID=2942214 RepID=UPI00201EE0DD|nr:2-dehydropantoate 2-reductase [Muricauda myxillae]MCL6265913.1 2-dehydropantoate 2-reductase [Muricauda myxillae]